MRQMYTYCWMYKSLQHQMDPSNNFGSYRSCLKAAMWRSEGAAEDREKVCTVYFLSTSRLYITLQIFFTGDDFLYIYGPFFFFFTNPISYLHFCSVRHLSDFGFGEYSL